MALSPTLVDREQGKFRDAGTVTKSRVAVIAEGNFTPSEEFDAIVATYPSSTQEVYTYKTGGVSGTTVMVITVQKAIRPESRAVS